MVFFDQSFSLLLHVSTAIFGRDVLLEVSKCWVHGERMRLEQIGLGDTPECFVHYEDVLAQFFSTLQIRQHYHRLHRWGSPAGRLCNNVSMEE